MQCCQGAFRMPALGPLLSAQAVMMLQDLLPVSDCDIALPTGTFAWLAQERLHTVCPHILLAP